MTRIAPLAADQLAAAAISLANNYQTSRIDGPELTQAMAAFLMPVTHEGVTMACVSKLIKAANDYVFALEAAYDPIEQADEKGGSWERHATKSLRRVEVVAAAICEGGKPE